MTTHICCRDCRFEAVVVNMDAERTVETHEEETGHNVASDTVDGPTRLTTDDGTDVSLLAHPGLDAVAAEKYDGPSECDWGCGSAADYRVELRLNGSATTSLICNDCSQTYKIWVEENELLRDEVKIDPLVKLDGEIEVEVECGVAGDSHIECDGWSKTVELDEPAEYVDGRIKLPGFGWECPECGNPHEFEVEGTWVSNLV